MSLWKMLKVGLIFMGIILVGINFFQADSAQSEIDWDHAIKGKTRLYFEAFSEKSKLEKDSFSFTYSQQMGYKLFGKMFKVDVSETRIFPAGLTPREMEMAFIEIFSSVSYSFESMQNSFPYSLSLECRNSSFLQEDLRGNAISLYLAMNNLELDSFKKEFPSSQVNTAYPTTDTEMDVTSQTIWASTIHDLRGVNNGFDSFLDQLSAFQRSKKQLSKVTDFKTTWLLE